MSSCLSGGGHTTYGFDLEIVKPPSPSIRTSHSSSPSSTISESSNSLLAISTRKPRTPRKRPNQTYNEAAALLSTAYPNIFSTKDITNPCKFIKPHEYSSFSFEESSAELLLPFTVEKSSFHLETAASVSSYAKPCQSPGEVNGHQANSSCLCKGYEEQEDFDAESILDEEIEEGVIDNIMGDRMEGSDSIDEPSALSNCGRPVSFCYGYPLGLGVGLGLGGSFDFGFGMRMGIVKAIRQTDEGDWWRFPTVDVGEISPRLPKVVTEKKKKKVDSPKPVEKSNFKPQSSTLNEENSSPNPKSSSGMLLKLNYNEVLNAWSDRGSPFSDEMLGSELSGTDALAKLAQIDLFGESGAVREASVQRYKEKRRTRLFSKKIRYQVRKVNADQRPRMKGRFVRRTNSSGSGE